MLLAQVSESPAFVDRGARRVCRAYLLGQLQPPELQTPEHLVVGADDAAARLLDLSRAAGQFADRVLDPTMDVWLRADHPLAVRLVEAEAEAYRSFMARVHTLAGY